MNGRASIFIFTFFVCNFHYIWSQTIIFPLIKKEKNYIQYRDTSALTHFKTSWMSSREADFVVLHLGDSHLQNENLPSHARKLFQEDHGNGGIGLIMPFSVVKTYNASNYKSTHTGDWGYSKSYMIPPKLVLGVRGMTGITKDANATFQIVFNQEILGADNKLKVFCSTADTSFSLQALADSIPLIRTRRDKDCIEFDLNQSFDTLSFYIEKTNATQRSFTLYGMNIQSQKTGGVWHNAGVGACQYKSVLYEKKFVEQVKILDPDVVIIDYGTNDFIYKNSILPELKGEILEVIHKVKQAAPSASIILTSSQDMLYKGRLISAGRKFELLIAEIAQEEQCGFWDWFDVSGGYKSMKSWQEAKWGRDDGIHLTQEGAQVKAGLLYDAMKNTMIILQSDTASRGLWFSLPTYKEEIIVKEKEKITKPKPESQKSTKTIVVKSGDTLSSIASKYKVSVQKIKKANGLNSDSIRKGQKLKIPSD